MVTVAQIRAHGQKPTSVPRVAFYERVSTDEQSERDTIRAQDRSLHKAYDHHFAEGTDQPWIYVGTFRDDGVSGTIPLDERPDGRRLMSLIRRGEVDLVCVSRSDRLARDRGVAEAIADEFWGRDVGIESTSEHIDLTTPAGRLQFALLCAFAHYERELIRDRTMAGRERHAGEGKFINGPVPFGYDVEDGFLVPSARLVPQLGCTEADLVTEIFERCAGGESLLGIMRWLRAAGVPSVKRYYNKKTERYKELSWPLWQHSRLLGMVNSKLYYGERLLKYNKPGSTKYRSIPAPITQSVPALVSKDLWQQAKKARQQHVSNFNTEREENYIYLLTGKLVCGSCGFTMIGNYHKGNKWHPTPRMHYACSRAKGKTNARRTGVVCPAPVYVNGDKLEEFAKLEIDKILERPEQIIDALRAQQVERHGKLGQHEVQKKALRQRLAGLERGRAGLTALVTTGELTADEYRVQTADNARQAAEVRRELELLENEETLAEILLGQLRDAEQRVETLKEAWPKVRNGPRKPLREYLQGLIQRVRVTKEREIEMTVLFDQRPSDKSYLCDFISVGRPVLTRLGTLVRTL